MRVTRVVLLVGLLSGCGVSRNHLGFHHFGEGRLGFSLVGTKGIRHLRDREDRWMVALSKLDLETLSADFAPGLASALPPDVRAKLVKQIERDYRPNGDFTRKAFGTPSFSTAKGARGDPFRYYDMVGFAYLMQGKVQGTVQFYVTRVEGSLKICGLEIVPVRESDRETAKEVRFVYPETVDRAHAKGHVDPLTRQ